jgi:membrane protease YdiL (CAAX protease family)
MIESVVTREVEREGSQTGSIVVFFLVTYGVTWMSWAAAWALSRGGKLGFPPPGLGVVLFYLGVFAPSLVALWLTRRREGSAGVRALLVRLVKVNVPVKWYVFAISYTVVIKLTAALIHRITTGSWPAFATESIILMLAAILWSMLIFGQAGEEVGWRGFALPRLRKRFGLGAASVLLGVIWATWHLPLFFIPGIETTGQSFPTYLLAVTAFSVAIAWLYANTNGSLFLTMLMHAAYNNTKDIVPGVRRVPTNPFTTSSSLSGWITLALLWLCAAYFLVRIHKADGMRE